jgi:hypothetical protein
VDRVVVDVRTVDGTAGTGVTPEPDGLAGTGAGPGPEEAAGVGFAGFAELGTFCQSWPSIAKRM